MTAPVDLPEVLRPGHAHQGAGGVVGPAVEEAAEALLTARRFLKHSYVAAWAIRDDVAKREVFESHQATLELLTERLSRMTMANIDPIFHEHGAKGIRDHFRSMAFHTSSVMEYMQRIQSLDHEL